MSREFVYPIQRQANLRDEPELVADTLSIPLPDTLVRRHGTNYRVTSISVKNARQTFPRYINNLVPLDQFPPDLTHATPRPPVPPVGRRRKTGLEFTRHGGWQRDTKLNRTVRGAAGYPRPHVRSHPIFFTLLRSLTSAQTQIRPLPLLWERT